MFATILEYDIIFDKILIETNIKNNKQKAQKFINIILEYPHISANKMLEIAISIDKNENIIFDGYNAFSIHPILNESTNINLMDIIIPLINKHIPKNIIGHLTEKHAMSIINKLLEVEFKSTDSVLDLRLRLDEMFSAGDITIPVNGLRSEANPIEVVMAGVFAPMLYKYIQFGKDFHKSPNSNKSTLRDVINNYTMVDNDTPLMKLLPKFILTLKDLLPSKESSC